MQQLTFLERFKRAFKKHPVTITILTINTIAILLTYLLDLILYNSLNLATAEGLQILNLMGALVPSKITNNYQYYRLITPIFLHGGLFHFLMNSYFLYIIGRFVEDLLGRKKFLLIYFISGLGSSLLVWLTSMQSNTPTIGASGALFGIMGALLILTYKKPLLFTPYGIRSIRTLVLINAFFTVFSVATGGNISFFGHLGGFLTGIAIMYLILPKYHTPERNNPFNPNNQTHHGNYIIDADEVSDDDIYYTN